MSDHDHDHDHDGDHEHDHDDEGWRRGEQDVSVEDIGPARKSLTIEVPGDRVTDAIGDTFDRLSDDAVIPGFRKGRAPMRLIQKRFGTGVREDVRGQLVSEAYQQAIEDNGLEVLGEPDVKDFEELELVDGKPLKFVVEIEVIPQFELPDLTGVSVEKPIVEVQDADVEEEIGLYRDRFGKMTAVTDGEVAVQDYVESEVRIYAGEDAGDDAEEIAHVPDTYVRINGKDLDYKGHVVGIVVDDLGKRMAGKKIGETEVISMTGPKGHENEKIKDQPITINIRIKQVQRVEPAEMAVVLEQAQVETEEELRDQIRQMLEQRVERKQRVAQHNQVSDYLLEKIEMELPEGMSGRQAGRVLQRKALEMAYEGIPDEKIQQTIAEMRDETEEDARKQLKLYFILDKAAKELNIEVTEGEVNGQIHMLAMQQGRRPEKLRQEMHRGGQLEQLYMQIRDQKTMDAILENANISEVELTDDDEKPAAKKKTSKKKSSKKKSAKKSDKKDDAKDEKKGD